jgi:gamma-glutamylcyclotransferase
VQMGPRIGGRLDGWRLAFNKIARSPKGAGAGNIVPQAGAVVHGTLNQMPEAGLDVLDIWEGVADGHYKRRTVPVVRADTGETVKAVTYVALKTGEGLKPTREYLSHLLAGEDLLPVEYHALLKNQDCLD